MLGSSCIRVKGWVGGMTMCSKTHIFYLQVPGSTKFEIPEFFISQLASKKCWKLEFGQRSGLKIRRSWITLTLQSSIKSKLFHPYEENFKISFSLNLPLIFNSSGQEQIIFHKKMLLKKGKVFYMSKNMNQWGESAKNAIFDYNHLTYSKRHSFSVDLHFMIWFKSTLTS